VASGGSSNLWPIPGGVVLGEGSPRIAIIVDTQVMGKSYGHALRRYLAGHSTPFALEVIEPGVCPIPIDNQMLILGGGVSHTQIAQRLSNFKGGLILLNPYFYPKDLKGAQKSSISAYFGEFSQSPASSEWRD